MLCEDGTIEDIGKKGYVLDLKVDGSLGVVERTQEGFKIYGRRGLTYTDILPEITEQLSKIAMFFRIIGEIVYISKEGKMIFAGSQKRCQISNRDKVEKYKKKYPVGIFVFDIVMLNGLDLTDVPYLARRKLLEYFYEMNTILYNLTNIRLTPICVNPENHKQFFLNAVENGYEGVIAKKLDGKYTEEKRSRAFLKIKVRDHTPFILHHP